MKIVLGTLLFINTAFAGSLGELGQKLLNLGAECNVEDENIHYCILDKNNFGYPNKTSIIFHKNAQIEHLLFHLHGHSFGPLDSGEDFDTTPEKMIVSFGIATSLRNHNSIAMVIPFTVGRCKDYDSYLAKGNNFENYILQLQELVSKDAKVHLSAHSGGGRTIAKTINRMKTVISSISLFDAIYNPPLTPQYISWVNLENKILNLIAVAPKKVDKGFKTVKGQTPYNESSRIATSLNWKVNFLKAISEVSKDFYQLQKSSKNSVLNFFYESANKKHHHWIIVKDSFPLILNTIDN